MMKSLQDSGSGPEKIFDHLEDPVIKKWISSADHLETSKDETQELIIHDIDHEQPKKESHIKDKSIPNQEVKSYKSVMQDENPC